MKEELIKRVAVVHEQTAEAFQNALNELLGRVKEPQIQFNMALGHCAYITYEELVRHIETAEDEYVEKTGERCHCGDCPYIQLSGDRRVKHHTCMYSEYPVRVDSYACELYYKRLLKGEI